MVSVHKCIASVFGIGYVGKGGGTIAAAACCLIWLLIASRASDLGQLLITLLIVIVGIWSGNVVDGVWGKDSSKVVIDEVAGMLVTIIFLPVGIKYIAIGLLLFRFFDIAKPLFIKNMERLPGGWGVMADDLLAGLYAHMLLMVIINYKIF